MADCSKLKKGSKAYKSCIAKKGRIEKVKSAGAEIVLDNVDQDYGGRGFTCKDLEGHLWSFGSYNPWE
jgi:uncharacterized glyoxalase superfamily protein PhnB